MKLRSLKLEKLVFASVKLGLLASPLCYKKNFLRGKYSQPIPDRTRFGLDMCVIEEMHSQVDNHAKDTFSANSLP